MTREEYFQFVEKEFDSILELIKKKNQDYTSGSNDPFKNFRMVENFGICSTEIGIATRLSDKFSRASTLIHKPPAVVNEGLEDSLRDIIGYSILMLGYLKSKQEKEAPMYFVEKGKTLDDKILIDNQDIISSLTKHYKSVTLTSKSKEDEL